MEPIEKAPLQITGNSLQHLSETRKWTMFISIFGLIFIGACIILIPILIFTSDGFFGLTSAGPLILMIIIYFFPIYYLFKFSINPKKAIQYLDNISFETAFKFLKLHYRFMGIFLIVVTVIYLLLGLFFLASNFLKNTMT